MAGARPLAAVVRGLAVPRGSRPGDADEVNAVGTTSSLGGDDVRNLETSDTVEGMRAAYRALEQRFLARTGELEDRGQLLDTVIATIPDAIIVIDETGIVQSFSAVAVRMFGFEADEVVGRNISMLMPPPYRDAHDGYLARYLETGEKRIIGSGRLVMGLRSNGTSFPMELYIGEMRLDDRRLFLGAVRDISSRQSVERRVQDLQAALLEAARLSTLGEMSSALAHELNQPLSAIMNYLDAGRHLLHAAGAELPPRALEMFEKAAGQAQRAGEVIQHMRQLARKGETDRVMADINVVVQDGAALASIGISRGSSALNFELSGALPTVLIDATQVQQVVVNLVRNSLEALEATPDGKVTVTTEPDGPDFVRVRIIDNGPGLAPEVAARLFQPFVTTKRNGTGIGLPICKTIVEGHGGRIAAVAADGGGACFTFTVPVAPTEAC